jgi:hypothetical protein
LFLDGYKLSSPEWWRAQLRYRLPLLIFRVIQAIGGSVAIGTLFTSPIAVAFLMSVYEKRLRADQGHRLT